MLKIEDIISKREIEELKNTGKYTKKNINKILKQYPSQYIIGYVNFYGNKIKVNKNVLIPRYETETLTYKTINYIKQKYKNKKIKILDLCTGSGCIAITLKKEIKNSDIVASDISNKAIKVAKENAKINNIKIIPIQALTTISDTLWAFASTLLAATKMESTSDSVRITIFTASLLVKLSTISQIIVFAAKANVVKPLGTNFLFNTLFLFVLAIAISATIAITTITSPIKIEILVWLWLQSFWFIYSDGSKIGQKI